MNPDNPSSPRSLAQKPDIRLVDERIARFREKAKHQAVIYGAACFGLTVLACGYLIFEKITNQAYTPLWIFWGILAIEINTLLYSSGIWAAFINFPSAEDIEKFRTLLADETTSIHMELNTAAVRKSFTKGRLVGIETEAVLPRDIGTLLVNELEAVKRD
jgi:hypothetical protein